MKGSTRVYLSRPALLTLVLLPLALAATSAYGVEMTVQNDSTGVLRQILPSVGVGSAGVRVSSPPGAVWGASER